MIGYRELQLIERLKEEASQLGFTLKRASYGEQYISLSPKDEEWVLYSRDASIFSGHVSDLLSFFAGIDFMREYDVMLKLSNSTKRDALEQKIKNKKFHEMLKTAFEED